MLRVHTDPERGGSPDHGGLQAASLHIRVVAETGEEPADREQAGCEGGPEDPGGSADE